MRVALVHDWLIHMRGGERVLEAIAEIFPGATIYTLFSNRKFRSPSLQKMKIKNSPLHYLPGIRSYYRWLLPLFPFLAKTLRIKDADLVISSSHCMAKAVPIPKDAIHICYCHSPMRYLWGFEEIYFEGFPKWIRAILEPIFSWLRNWDVETSRGVHHFFCNSENIRQRIQTIYKRDARVIHPPVDAKFFSRDSLSKSGEPYYLVVSALTPYKRDDLVIDAFQGFNRKLIIAGDGPLRKRYEQMIKTDNIQMIGKASDEQLRQLYTQARALIFPQLEDFGIIPLEAQACGTPVIAFARGGALETVKHGIFFEDQTSEAIRKGVLEFENRSFDPEVLRSDVLQFDKPAFKNKIKEAIDNVIH